MTANNSDPTQCSMILDYIKKHGSITHREASIHLCVARLPSRIHELRHNGFNIVGKMESGKNAFGKTCSYKRYFLVEDKEEASNGN